MLRMSFILILAGAVCCLQSAIAEFAFELEKCPYDDAACATKVGNFLLKNYGSTGSRTLNLIPFDPLHIKSLIIHENPNSPLKIGLNFKDIEVLGLTNMQNAKASGFSRDLKGPILLEGTVPKAIIRGPYSGSGSILGLPFKGSGDCEIALTNLKLTCALHVKLVKKGADDYLTIDDVKLTISKPDNVSFKFGGLFDGNQELAKTAHTFVNQNWPDIFGELQPAMENTFGLIVHGITKNVFAKYPYADFFLP